MYIIIPIILVVCFLLIISFISHSSREDHWKNHEARYYRVKPDPYAERQTENIHKFYTALCQLGLNPQWYSDEHNYITFEFQGESMTAFAYINSIMVSIRLWKYDEQGINTHNNNPNFYKLEYDGGVYRMYMKRFRAYTPGDMAEYIKFNLNSLLAEKKRFLRRKYRVTII